MSVEGQKASLFEVDAFFVVTGLIWILQEMRICLSKSDLVPYPQIYGWGELMILLSGMLGLGVYRSLEKKWGGSASH
jgi:hypothetical protein